MDGTTSRGVRLRPGIRATATDETAPSNLTTEAIVLPLNTKGCELHYGGSIDEVSWQAPSFYGRTEKRRKGHGSRVFGLCALVGLASLGVWLLAPPAAAAASHAEGGGVLGGRGQTDPARDRCAVREYALRHDRTSVPGNSSRYRNRSASSRTRRRSFSVITPYSSLTQPFASCPRSPG